MPIALSGTNGITFPTWTTATRPASPATGQTGFNTTTSQMETYDGTQWEIYTAVSSQGTSGRPLISGGSGVAPSFTTLGISAITATGTPSATTYLRGDASWASITGVPSGSVMPYAGSSAPTDWLLCSGAAVSRTTYAALFAVVGTTYGSGDGSTTFNLPDLRGRAAFGVDNMGGTAANRITSGGSGITGTTLGAAGGAETVTLSTSQIPSHNHTVAYATGSSGGQWNQGSGTASSQSSTGSTGGGGAHNTVPPAIILNYIIKT